jgi:GTPase SAR1 family protein
MLVFDLTDPSSFKELEYWVGELDFRMEKNDLTVVVVGNKADKAGRAVPKPVIDNWISMYPEFKYTEVSAMTGMGVNRAF